MTRQKSEDSNEPEAPGNLGQTERARGGRGVPVNKVMEQLGLPLATAEYPKGANPGGGGDRSSQTQTGKVPKARGKTRKSPSATMESLIESLDEALDRVVRNKGAPGPDGRSVEAIQLSWPSIKRALVRSLRDGSYIPGAIRRVEIPKPDGGIRKLGIPNVLDRVVQAGLKLCIEPEFEPEFHASSHGFRPARSCHTALREAQKYVDAGYTWVVDLDLSKFFDRVHHQRLMARVARKVQERPLLVLLGRFLKAPVQMLDGQQIPTTEGVPQGGPLSPLLSNIVLDELDQELARRGHRFVRYADDVAIFVRSERSGIRVMESITRFIEGRMRLKVNSKKSSVRRPDTGNFLGFRLELLPDGRSEIRVSDRTMSRALARIRELTPRNWGGSLRSCISRLDRYLTGWFGFFGICAPSGRRELQKLDGRGRRRLRAIQIKQWKRKRTVVRKLNGMKYSHKVGRNLYRGRRGPWSMSHDGVVSHRLNTRWFLERGLTPLTERLTERVLATAALKTQLSFTWG